MTKTVSDNIKKRRENLKITQTALADKAKVMPNYIVRIESGQIINPSYSKIVAINLALDDLEAAS